MNKKRNISHSRRQYFNKQLFKHVISSPVTDIPGFHYDEETKRYYRIPSGPGNQNLFKTIINKRKEQLSRFQQFSTSRENIIKLLNKQQLTGIKSNSLTDSGRQLEQSRLKCVKRIKSNDSGQLHVKECRYLIGNANSLALAAVYSNKLTDSAYTSFDCLHLENSKADSLHLKWKGVMFQEYINTFTDLCFTEQHNVLSIVSTTVNCVGRGVAYIAPFNEFNSEISLVNYFGPVHTPLWSCAWNKNTNRIAVGGDRYLYINAFRDFDTVKFSEKCFSLAYNETGNVLYVGGNESKLSGIDLRIHTSIFCCKVGRGISFLQLLNNENSIIASAYDGKLIQVDLRMQKSVLEYPGHINHHMKLPFSVDESSDILCSVGQDHTTRLWSLKNGKLLNSIPPEYDSRGPYQPMAWFSNSWQVIPQIKKSCLVLAIRDEILIYKY